MSQTSKRKSRAGVVITAHKGGRSKSRLAPMTEDTAQKLNEVLAHRGESFGDWVERLVNVEHVGMKNDKAITSTLAERKMK